MPSITLLDLAKINGTATDLGLIEENLTAAPEAQIIPARMIKGTSFRSLVRTTFPTVGFRNANEGRTPQKSVYANRIHETYYLDSQMELDNAIVNAAEAGPDYVLTAEASGHMKGALLALGSQMWYGRANDPKGFPGAIDFVDAAHTVDATGSTANAASSCYLAVVDPRFFQFIFGNNMALSVSEWRKQTLTNGTTKQTVWNNSLEGWVGIEFLNIHAVVCIKNLTIQAGKSLSDSLLAQAMAKFPVGIRPTHIFCNRVQRQLLQTSRSVSIFGQGNALPGAGQGIIAPTPSSYEGVPIIATDSLLQTEALR